MSQTRDLDDLAAFWESYGRATWPCKCGVTAFRVADVTVAGRAYEIECAGCPRVRYVLKGCMRD